MTTNVFDSQAKIIASDSRWSFGTDFAIFYVDDTGFDKVVVGEDLSFMFAGNAERIGVWKEWLASPARVVMPMPHPNGIAICAVEMTGHTVAYKRGQQVVGDAFFAGTGTEPASGCWKVNRDAKRAVETAKAIDVYSGGDVKFFEIPSSKHNLGPQATYQSSVDQLKKRGMVMYIQSSERKSVSIQEASANDPRVRDVAERIISGELKLTAPCPSVHTDWSDDEVNELSSVVQKYLRK